VEKDIVEEVVLGDDQASQERHQEAVVTQILQIQQERHRVVGALLEVVQVVALCMAIQEVKAQAVEVVALTGMVVAVVEEEQVHSILHRVVTEELQMLLEAVEEQAEDMTITLI
jgi:hypothetical protein